MRYGSGEGAAGRMKGKGETEVYRLLDDYRLDRPGLRVKLERGFEQQEDGEQPTYYVSVEFDELAERIGFQAAHEQAGKYCALLKSQLIGSAGYSIGETENATHTEDPNKQNPGDTLMTIPIIPDDGRYDDAAMMRAFRPAKMRAWMQWDADAKRHDNRRTAFRTRLAGLLDGDAYSHLDGATRQRLLEEVPAIAFLPKGVDR